MTDAKQERLQSASNPRLATLDDVIPLSRLFASAFMDDPVFDYMVRSGEKRRAALEMFFKAMFTARDIPQNEVWMSNDGNACVSLPFNEADGTTAGYLARAGPGLGAVSIWAGWLVIARVGLRTNLTPWDIVALCFGVAGRQGGRIVVAAPRRFNLTITSLAGAVLLALRP